MAGPNPSVKRVLIDKANSTVVAVTAGTCFIVVFCLIAAHTLVGQLAYQNRVIGKKKAAVSQLKTDIASTQSLVSSYKAFVSTSQNIIGGNPSGTGAQDGDNAKIVLDALPSKYDFPALTTSLEKLLTSQNVTIVSISGTDDSASQSGSSSSPQPIAMPFQLSITGSYSDIQNVINTFQSSIRPFQIQTMELNGSDSNMTLNLTAQTFYQPEKDLNIRMETVQ